MSIAISAQTNATKCAALNTFLDSESFEKASIDPIYYRYQTDMVAFNSNALAAAGGLDFLQKSMNEKDVTYQLKLVVESQSGSTRKIGCVI
jgi:hypothetical protein